MRQQNLVDPALKGKCLQSSAQRVKCLCRIAIGEILHLPPNSMDNAASIVTFAVTRSNLQVSPIDRDNDRLLSIIQRYRFTLDVGEALALRQREINLRRTIRHHGTATHIVCRPKSLVVQYVQRRQRRRGFSHRRQDHDRRGNEQSASCYHPSKPFIAHFRVSSVSPNAKLLSVSPNSKLLELDSGCCDHCADTGTHRPKGRDQMHS